MSSIRRIATQLAPPTAAPTESRLATVQGVAAGKVVVRFAGSAVDVPALCLGSYVPAAGDVVSVLRKGPDLLVLGAVKPGAPLAVVTRSAALATTAATEVAVPFTAATKDLFGMWSAGSPNRLTVPAGMAGWWRFTWHCQNLIASSAVINNNGYAQIRKNSVSQYRVTQAMAPVITGGMVVAEYQMADGDWVDVTVYTVPIANPTDHRLVAHRVSS